MNDTIDNYLTNQTSSRISIEILLQKILIGCLLFSLSIFTIFGNLIVLYSIRTEKRLRTVSNLFILSLAFADLIVGFLVMPFSIIHIIIGHWPFSRAICQMWLSIDYVASTASIFNLILLSLDRYWAVVYPLLYLQNRSRKRAISLIIIIWLISFLWTPAIIFWSSIIPQHSDIIKSTECDTSFRSNKLFKTLTALVNFYIPLLTMIIISCRIMTVIRSRSKMEYGRRISSTTRKLMKQERSYINTSIVHNEHEQILTKHLSSNENNEQMRLSMKIIATDSFQSSVDNPNNSIDQSIENDQICEYSNVHQTPFHFSYVKPMKILFPSLKSTKEYDKRRSEILPYRYSITKNLPNSFSVSKNMKYLHRKSFTELSSSSSSDECSHTIVLQQDGDEQQISKMNKQLSICVTNPSSYQTQNSLSSTNDIQLNRINSNKTINLIKFFDSIINPSRSRSLQKELKAARQLGLLVGAFTITWLPYFILFLVVAWCQYCISENIYTISIWLGYFNSTLNPLIYPLCNKHFRRAFSKIFSCHYTKTKLPNLDELRELHTLHSTRHRR